LHYLAFFKVALIVTVSAVLMACQQAGNEAESTVHTIEPASAPTTLEPYAVAQFRTYWYDTKSAAAKVQLVIASHALQEVDGAKNGYTKAPQRGARRLFPLPSSGYASDTFNLVVNDVGVCAIRVSGPAAEKFERDFVAGFQALEVSTTQLVSVKAVVYIPYGKTIRTDEVREHRLVNTMTAAAPLSSRISRQLIQRYSSTMRGSTNNDCRLPPDPNGVAPCPKL
jgi:hypothetical protein